MSDNSNAGSNQSMLDVLYSRLPQKDVEEFYAGYIEWALQNRMKALQDASAILKQQIDANSEQMHAAQPSAVALATLARLQANGVSDIELLDRMLDRGEEWLDATMQRLDYCEQLDDFLSDDYDQWCRHALDGAYDWIDSLRRQAEEETAASQLPSSAPPETSEEALSEATEEMMLSKLSSDEAEEEESLLEITLKRPAMIPFELQGAASEQPVPSPGTEQILREARETVAFEEPGDESGFIPASLEHEQLATQEYIAPEVVPSEEESSTSTDEQPVIQEFVSSEESFPTESINADSDELPLQEFVPGRDNQPAESGERFLQEFVPAAETTQTEYGDPNSEEAPLKEFAPAEEFLFAEDRDAGNEEPALQEFTAPQVPPVPVEGNVSAASAGDRAEETVGDEASDGHGDSVSTANAVGTGEPAATGQNQPFQFQWEWMTPPDMNSSENLEDQPKRRSNFLWRLLAKIWGR
jgi:hypothetical protein